MALFKCLQDNSWDGLQGYRKNVIYDLTSNPDSALFEAVTAASADAEVIGTTPLPAWKDRQGDWHVDVDTQFTGDVSVDEMTANDITTTSLSTDYIDFDTDTSSDDAEGRLKWSSTEDTISVGMPGGNVNLQVGMEMYIPRRVQNNTGADMKNGDLVYISSGSGNNVYVTKAQADAEATASTTIAMLTEDIDDNAKGFATTFGLVRGTASQPIDTSAYEPGDTLYLSPATAGAFTGTLPVHPNYAVRIGQVFRKHTTEGAVMVYIQNPITAKCMAGGESAVYDDLQISISNIKLPASNAPTWRQYDHGIGGGVTFPVLGFAIGNYVYFDVQTPHSMLIESVLNGHIHYCTPTDGTGTKVKFQADVIYAAINGTWAVPAGSPYTKEWDLDGDFSDKHKYQDIADIPAVNTSVSTLYKVRFERIAASADDYAGEVYLEFSDCHHQKDSIGSRTEMSKG